MVAGGSSHGKRVLGVGLAALGVWDFVVGDDWRTALGVVIAFGITAVLASSGIAAWWVMPVAVPLLLFASVWRVARDARG